MSNVEIIISGNDAKIMQMFAKMKSEQDAVEKRFGKIKDASKKSADEVMKHWEGFGASLASIDGGMGNVVKNITAFAGGFVTAQAAAEVISARLDNIVAKQKEAGKLFTEIAPAQAGAALNLGTADPETVKQLLVDVVPKVATEADFPNLQALTKAVEDLASSGESNVQALEAALIAGAKLTREKPEAVGALSAAGIRVGRSAGLTDPESAISLVGSSQALTPIKDIANYAQNLGIVLQSSRIAMKDQPVGAVAQETTALFAALSQAGGKPTGEELTTFISPVISKLDALFEGRADDPKSLKGRIDALRNNPELRAEFMGDAPDSAVYSVPLNEMLTQGTELAKSLDDALGKITTDVSVFQRMNANVGEGTPQLFLTKQAKSVEAQIEVNKMANEAGATVDTIANIRRDAMNATDLTMSQWLSNSLYQGNLFRMGGGGEGSSGWMESLDRSMIGRDPERFALTTNMALLQRRESLAAMPATKETEAAIKTIDAALESIKNIQTRAQGARDAFAEATTPFDLPATGSTVAPGMFDPSWQVRDNIVAPDGSTIQQTSSDLVTITDNLKKTAEALQTNLSGFELVSQLLPSLLQTIRRELTNAENAERRGGRTSSARNAGRP